MIISKKNLQFFSCVIKILFFILKNNYIDRIIILRYIYPDSKVDIYLIPKSISEPFCYSRPLSFSKLILPYKFIAWAMGIDYLLLLLLIHYIFFLMTDEKSRVKRLQTYLSVYSILYESPS